MYINSTSGMAHLDNCDIEENGSDGVKYVHHDQEPDERFDRRNVFDLCTFPRTEGRTFPITISMEQSSYSPNKNKCQQVMFFVIIK